MPTPTLRIVTDFRPDLLNMTFYTLKIYQKQFFYNFSEIPSYKKTGLLLSSELGVQSRGCRSYSVQRDNIHSRRALFEVLVYRKSLVERSAEGSTHFRKPLLKAIKLVAAQNFLNFCDRSLSVLYICLVFAGKV